nr:MAG TPA: hypothetical protein [Caudoviricetes sp.]
MQSEIDRNRRHRHCPGPVWSAGSGRRWRRPACI